MGKLGLIPRWRTRNSAIALDLGRGTLRAMQLRTRYGRVERIDALALPATPEQEPGALDACIERAARMLGQAGFAGQDVTLALGAPHLTYLPLRMPERLMTHTAPHLAEAVRWEVIRETGAEPGELEVRHWPLTHSKSANVLAVATAAAPLVGCVEHFERHGLLLRRIEPAPCALVRAARRGYSPADGAAWGVLDLGRRQTTLTVVINATPHYIRDLRFSGDAMTQRVADAFDVSVEDAERLKRDHGVAPAQPAAGARAASAAPPAGVSQEGALAEGASCGDELSNVIFGVLRADLDELVRQIVACFAYALNGLPELEVAHLVIAGGGAGLPGLADLLELQCGLSVSRLTETERGAEIRGVDGAVVYGAALGDLES